MKSLAKIFGYAASLFCLSFAIFGGALTARASVQTTTINVPTPTKPSYITTGDVNSDTYPDIVVKSGTLSEYYLILNNGAGGFLPATTNPMPDRSFYLNLRDFNNDGKLDLFYLISPTSQISGVWSCNVRLGDGAGNFGAPITTNLIGSVSIVDIDFAHFNNDTFLDVAMCTYGPGVSVPGGGAIVAVGNGAGGFTSNPFIGLRPRGSSIAAGDFNQDGKQDLMAFSFGASNIGSEPAMQILLNDGTGNFPTVIARTQSEYLHAAFSVGDMNNDGKVDVTGVRVTVPNTIGTLLGTGAGDIVLGGSFSPGTISPGDVRVADFNNDGKLDAAFASSSTNLAYVLFGNGLGGFSSFISLGTGVAPNRLDIADFNRNGTPDLAISNSDSSYLTVILDPNSSTPPPKTQFDFDGDLRADVSVYRDGNTPNAPSYWHIFKSSNNTYEGYQLGMNGDKPVPADWNGDGKTDVAVWRPSTGIWYTSTNPSTNYGAFHWGQNGDVPLPGDFDGDGKADRAVWRPSNGTWYVYRSSNGGFQMQQFGVSTDKPVLGDFDGDSKTDYAFYRPGATALANSFWNVIQSSNGAFLSAQFGRGEDKPVPADYDGNGITNFAVYRPSNFTWYRSLNTATNYDAIIWGTEGDVPAPADYDRDGKADVAVFRPGSSIWYILRTSDGIVTNTKWGVPSDKPLPASFIP
jgi:hypothetical protein